MLFCLPIRTESILDPHLRATVSKQFGQCNKTAISYDCPTNGWLKMFSATIF